MEEYISNYTGEEMDSLLAEIPNLKGSLATPDTDADVEAVWNSIINS